MQKRYIPFALLLVIMLVVLSCLSSQNVLCAPTFAFAAEEKQVYLTFDDGPSTTVTSAILDTLKEENVKATFFIVSDRAQTRKEILKRIDREGHTVGIHSASHDYTEIYASDEALLKDIQTCANFIHSVTGKNPAVYRFPGGGIKEIGRKKRLVENKGYRVVGWNAVCGDEELIGADAQTLFLKAKETSAGKNRVILLCHDSVSHMETAKALKDIIGYFRSEGYTFCAF